MSQKFICLFYVSAKNSKPVIIYVVRYDIAKLSIISCQGLDLYMVMLYQTPVYIN